ncbi:MFS transporter [Pyrobaculum neutrophilum]|uniref:Major facilitator superfamily MFS_1 n=1 Tax=Pyrobaculum neutrophilum (strain DSM 2338 / JCM 9278 / NBRC 100436 / V24Sta) TaxID=444157 RepID=B1YCS0_PYRNV|nr:MFS transporter [Pyrobaculum neutrophilum]ACB39583.1 major facilitator superfamily MFS_1 [Pyrobaculum neutrophilum V24Sta]
MLNLFLLVLLSRGVYALMWFYIAPLLPAMLRDYGVDPAYAGLLPAAFVVGAALMQLPASYLGARYGHNKVAGFGMVLFGVSSVLMALAPSWGWALAFRALGGVGAGLFFSTAGAVLVALSPSSVGSALGWYGASFNLGGFVGFYWGAVASVLGWRPALALPGLLSAALGVALVRHGAVKSRPSLEWRAAAYGLASFPFWGAVYAANNLAATWLHLYRGVGEWAAGAVSSASMLSGLLGGLTGRLYDAGGRGRSALLAAASTASIAFLAMPWAPLEAVPLLAFLYGLSFSTYMTGVYAASSRAAQNPASALAVINVTNMALGLHVSYLFSWLMAQSPDYPWLFLASLALASAVATYAVVVRAI